MGQVLSLCDGHGMKKIVGYITGKDRHYQFLLYEKKYSFADKKWHSCLIGKYNSFQHMLYIAGNVAKLNGFHED